ncbi:MAG: fasciclin domain-containing protein [Anaerolineae bacterium]
MTTRIWLGAKNLLLLLSLCMLLAIAIGSSGVSVRAQEATADPTPEATAEATAEPVLYSRLRVGLFAAAAPHIDLYVDDRLIFRDVPYPAMTNYFTLPARLGGVITVTASGDDVEDPLLPPLQTDLLTDHAYTLAVLAASPATTDPALAETETPAPSSPYQSRLIDETAIIAQGSPGTARLLTLNAIPGEVMNTQFGDQTLDIAFTDFPTLSLPPSDLLLSVQLGSGAHFANTLSLRADLLYFIVIYGTAESPQPKLEVSGTRSLAQLLHDSADFSLFYALVDDAGLVETLTLDAPFTIFAPSNAAFERYMAENGLQSDSLLGDQELVNQIVRYHIARGLMFSDTVASLALVPMLDGHDVGVAQDANGLLLNQTTRILMADVLATNGVIHAVDTVLEPPKNPEEGS